MFNQAVPVVGLAHIWRGLERWAVGYVLSQFVTRVLTSDAKSSVETPWNAVD